MEGKKRKKVLNKGIKSYHGRAGRGRDIIKKHINRRKTQWKRPVFQAEFADFVGHALAKRVLHPFKEKSG